MTVPADLPGSLSDSDVLVVTRSFAAPRSLVFKVWTDPVHASRWWGPQGFALLACEMDVRPGGRWRRLMRSPEGVLSCKRGAYREIVPPERLVFTYADEDERGVIGHETLVTITFAEDGDGTRLVLHQAAFLDRATRDSHHGGWGSALERCADHLARGDDAAPGSLGDSIDPGSPGDPINPGSPGDPINPGSPGRSRDQPMRRPNR